jgi:hypothetical protein
MRPGASARVRRALTYARQFAVEELRYSENRLPLSKTYVLESLVGEIEQALEALSLIEEECQSPVVLWCGAERPGWQKPQVADGLDPADRRKAGLGCMMNFDEPWWRYAYRCGTCGAWFHQGCLELHLRRRPECDLAGTRSG